MPHTSFNVQNFSAADLRRTRVLDGLTGPACSKQDHEMRNFLYLGTSFTQLLRDGLAGPVTAMQKEFPGHVLVCTGDMRQLLNSSTFTVVAEQHSSPKRHAVTARSNNYACA